MHTPEQPSRKRQLLETFDLNGEKARVLRLRPEDLEPKDVAELSENLTDTNFQLLNIPNAKTRMKIQDVLVRIREAIAHIPVIGMKIAGPKQWDTLGQEIYPDYTRGQHTRSSEWRYNELAEKNQLFGVQIEGRIVALQGFKMIGKTHDGRPVFEFSKASTMNDLRYRKRGLNTRIKKTIFQEVEKEFPDAVWVTVSRNAEHLERFRRRGWHVVEMDDVNEIARVEFNTSPEYHAHMMNQGYKTVYCDPKVDTITWGKSE